MPYDPNFVKPMREELTRVGVHELLTVGDVDAFFADRTGTKMLVINSVCGCAAGSARPGVILALQNSVRPDKVATVFAGQDLDAAAQARSYFPDTPPSSPSVAIIKNGEVVHFIPRHMIEGRHPQGVAEQLIAAFEKHCATPSAS